jgi:hypothetical protein
LRAITAFWLQDHVLRAITAFWLQDHVLRAITASFSNSAGYSNLNAFNVFSAYGFIPPIPYSIPTQFHSHIIRKWLGWFRVFREAHR